MLAEAARWLGINSEHLPSTGRAPCCNYFLQHVPRFSSLLSWSVRKKPTKRSTARKTTAHPALLLLNPATGQNIALCSFRHPCKLVMQHKAITRSRCLDPWINVVAHALVAALQKHAAVLKACSRPGHSHWAGTPRRTAAVPAGAAFTAACQVRVCSCPTFGQTAEHRRSSCQTMSDRHFAEPPPRNVSVLPGCSSAPGEAKRLAPARSCARLQRKLPSLFNRDICPL